MVVNLCVCERNRMRERMREVVVFVFEVRVFGVLNNGVVIRVVYW